MVKAHLKANGMAMKQGTIIDATLIAAPSSTKNEKKERDPEMHQTCKGKQWGLVPRAFPTAGGGEVVADSPTHRRHPAVGKALGSQLPHMLGLF